MAVNNTLKITRKQLNKFMEDPDTLKQFELLFSLVNSLGISGEETLEEMITRIHGTLP